MFLIKKDGIMKMLFFDKSFNFNVFEPFFILGGVVIDEDVWHGAEQCIKQIKYTQNIDGEIKYRWVFNEKNKDNTLYHLSQKSRLEKVLQPVCEFIRDNNIKILTTLTHINDLQEQFILETKIEKDSAKFKKSFAHYYYYKNYENMVQRFQYYLQRCHTNKESYRGRVICDCRSMAEDEALRTLHKEMLFGKKGMKKINYINLIEHLLVAPSHYSVGIQFADIVAGVIFGMLRKCQKTAFLFDAIRNCFVTHNGTPNGAGVGKIPHKTVYWRRQGKTQG